MTETFTRTHLRDDQETEVEVDIVVEGWGSAGSYWEPPEGMEMYLDKAALLDGTPVTLTDAEVERMEKEFCENPPEQDYDDYD